MPRCYLAAPLFTEAERAFNASLAKALGESVGGLEVLLPQVFCAAHDQAADGPDYAAIFATCVDRLARADLVVAVLDGPDPDSGTCWELGWAYARGLPAIGLRTDLRPGEDGGGNCMLTRSCRAWSTTVAECVAAVAAWAEPPR